MWKTEPEAGVAGSTVLVTGAGAGIGAAACELFARGGATVHMLVRDAERGEKARAEIARRSGSDRLQLEICDVSSLAAVREFTAAFASEHGEIHTLVHNAGVMPATRTTTGEGFELTWATNVLGPFLLTALLLPALRAGSPSRVINVSSGGMYAQKLRPDDLQLEGARVQPDDRLRPHQALPGDPDRALGRAPARQRHRRPRDASRLGRHSGSADVAAAISLRDAAAAAKCRAGSRHDRLARRRAGADASARVASGTTERHDPPTAFPGRGSRRPTVLSFGPSACGCRG